MRFYRAEPVVLCRYGDPIGASVRAGVHFSDLGDLA